MNKNLITYIVGVAVIAGFIVVMVIAAGSSNGTLSNVKQIAYSAGSLSIVETDYNFGTIRMSDGDVAHNFEVKNESSESVVISEISTSCACTTAYVVEESGEKHGSYGMLMGNRSAGKANIEILSGSSVTLEAVFDPAFHGPEGTGKIKRIVYLETNSQTKPKLEVTFEADVTK